MHLSRCQTWSDYTRLFPSKQVRKQQHTPQHLDVTDTPVLRRGRLRKERICTSFGASASVNGNGGTVQSGVNSGSGGARARRLAKVKEERKKRESEYPEWAKILEEAVKDDAELREVLGDSVGNPDAMKAKINQRVMRKGNDIMRNRTGSAIPMQVVLRNHDPFDLHIWLELYDKPTEKQVNMVGGVFRSWFLLGRLGAFNSMNIQLTEKPAGQAQDYSQSHQEAALQAYFHNIGDVEFQDNWARVWVDLGTSDPLALDILINALITLSSENVGIKQLVVGGSKLGDWEEGMVNPDDGYQSFVV